MGFKFRKSIKILPGVKVNVSNKGINSVSVGRRGASTNFGRKGVRSTIGLPGTGLSHSSYTPYNQQKQENGMYDEYISYRPISIWLGLGIFFLPFIFAWLTLREGHTIKSRIISFLWLLVSYFYHFDS